MGVFDDLIPAENLGKFAKDSQGRNVIPPAEELSLAEDIASRIKIPSWMQSLIGNSRSFARGAADPVVGGAQLVGNMIGQGDAVNKFVAEQEAKQNELTFNPDSGWNTAARIAGNIASPVNLLPAARVAAAPAASLTARQMATQGAGYGAAGAALEPVTDAAEKGFWDQKAGQVVAGTVAGGAFGPIVGKAGQYLIEAKRAQPNAVITEQGVERAIRAAMEEIGEDMSSISSAQLQALKSQVANSLKAGETVDPAALLRKADFEALGIKPLQGQITRDPMQYATELNLRGVAGVGEPIAARLSEQAAEIQRRLNALAPQGKTAFQAGEQLTGSLGNIDEILRKHVSGLYGEARQSAGKDLDVPLTGLAQDYARILGDFADSVPAAIRGKFAELGLDPSMPGNQRKAFTVESADQLLKVINKNRSSEPAVNAALSELRGAIKGAVEQAAPDGGVFAPAVKAASERFKLHEAIPALGAVVEGRASPDDFVQRFLVNGKTNDVKEMAKALKAADPDAFMEARAQIAETIRSSAFGTLQAGGDRIASERLAGTLKRLGPDKLQAFFSPEEVSDLMRVARVQAYISKEPAGAAVNRSNTAGALMNLAGNVPGLSLPAALANKAVQAASEKRQVQRALSGEVPTAKRGLSPNEINALRKFLMPGAGAAGFGSAAYLE